MSVYNIYLLKREQKKDEEDLRGSFPEWIVIFREINGQTRMWKNLLEIAASNRMISILSRDNE